MIEQKPIHYAVESLQNHQGINPSYILVYCFNLVKVWDVKNDRKFMNPHTYEYEWISVLDFSIHHPPVNLSDSLEQLLPHGVAVVIHCL